MLTAGEVPIEPCALPELMSELQLDKLFERFQASVRGVLLWIYVEFIA